MSLLDQIFWSNFGPLVVHRETLIKRSLNFLFERKKISSINQQLNGGVAQLVRARDS